MPPVMRRAWFLAMSGIWIINSDNIMAWNDRFSAVKYSKQAKCFKKQKYLTENQPNMVFIVIEASYLSCDKKYGKNDAFSGKTEKLTTITFNPGDSVEKFDQQ